MVNNVKKILLAIGHEKVENIIKKQILNNPYYSHNFIFSEKPAVYREGLIRMIGQENPDILILRETLQGAIDLSQLIFEIRTTYPLLRIVLLTKERPVGDDFLYEMVGVGIYDIINQSTNIDINKIIEMIVTPNTFAAVSKYRPAVKEILPNGKKIFDTQGTIVITKENNKPQTQSTTKEETKIKQTSEQESKQEGEQENTCKEEPNVPKAKQKVVVVNMEDVINDNQKETPIVEVNNQSCKNTDINSIEQDRKKMIKQKELEQIKQKEEEEKLKKKQEEEQKLIEQKKREEELEKQELLKQQKEEKKKLLEDKQKQEQELKNAKLHAKEEKARLKEQKRKEQELKKQKLKIKNNIINSSQNTLPQNPLVNITKDLPTSTPLNKSITQKNNLFSGLFNSKKKNNKNSNMNNNVFSQNKVLSFVGARQGVGTTTLGFNTAIGLAKQGKKVIYIELEENISALSYWYKFYVEVGLEAFPKYLRNNEYEKALDCILTSEELHEIDKKHKIYPKTLDMLLFSAHYMLNPLSRQELSEENINEVITFLLIQLDYDYVIVDCLLSNPQLVNHVLLCSTFTHFIVTQEPLDIALVYHFLQNRRLPLRNYDYVINQYTNCNFSYKQINKWLNDAPTIYINNYKGTLIDCNYNGIPIYVCGNNDKVKQIQTEINQLFI